MSVAVLERCGVNGMVKTRSWILLLGDILVFYLSLVLVLFVRYQSFTLLKEHVVPFSLIFILWMLALYVLGLYDVRNLKNNLQFLKLLGVAGIINILIATSFFYLFPGFGIRPRANLLLFTIVSAFLVYLWRSLFNVLLGVKERRRILIIGRSADVKEFAAYLEKNLQLGYEVTHILQPTAKTQWEKLSSRIATSNITTVALTAKVQKNPLLIKVLFENLGLGIDVIAFADLYEEVFRKTPFTELEEAWFLENVKNERSLYRTVKRPLELALASIFALAVLPIMAIVAFLIRITSAGPIIYKQVRAGFHGRNFTLYKFRTMQKDAEATGPQWAKENDPRLTPIGGFLRRTHLDELPQLWNIVRGDLSFVGPRPERPEFVTELIRKIPFYEIRHLVKPGFTGWAQVNYRYGSSVSDALEKLKYDIFYIKHRSLVFDILIILKSIRLLFVNPK